MRVNLQEVIFILCYREQLTLTKLSRGASAANSFSKLWQSISLVVRVSTPGETAKLKQKSPPYKPFPIINYWWNFQFIPMSHLIKGNLHLFLNKFKSKVYSGKDIKSEKNDKRIFKKATGQILFFHFLQILLESIHRLFRTQSSLQK